MGGKSIQAIKRSISQLSSGNDVVVLVENMNYWCNNQETEWREMTAVSKSSCRFFVSFISPTSVTDSFSMNKDTL